MKPSSNKLRGVARKAALVLACASPGLAPALAQSASGPVTYQLDPDHTFATFEVLHFGTSTLRGRIGPMRPRSVEVPKCSTSNVAKVWFGSSR